MKNGEKLQGEKTRSALLISIYAVIAVAGASNVFSFENIYIQAVASIAVAFLATV